jgi:hypothetical protein
MWRSPLSAFPLFYFEFLRLDWQSKFRYTEVHPDEDMHKLLPHKQLRQIPSDLDMLQKQIMRLFEDVLDSDDDKKACTGKAANLP